MPRPSLALVSTADLGDGVDVDVELTEMLRPTCRHKLSLSSTSDRVERARRVRRCVVSRARLTHRRAALEDDGLLARALGVAECADGLA